MTFDDPFDPMTAIPAGFTNVSGDGKTVSGPITGVSGVTVAFGNQASLLNLGTFSADLGGINFTATTTGTASLAVTAGGIGVQTTGVVTVNGFQQIVVDNTVTAGSVIFNGQTVVANQTITADVSLVLQRISGHDECDDFEARGRVTRRRHREHQREYRRIRGDHRFRRRHSRRGGERDGRARGPDRDHGTNRRRLRRGRPYPGCGLPDSNHRRHRHHRPHDRHRE